MTISAQTIQKMYGFGKKTQTGIEKASAVIKKNVMLLNKRAWR
jgi:hypothetical protein